MGSTGVSETSAASSSFSFVESSLATFILGVLHHSTAVCNRQHIVEHTISVSETLDAEPDVKWMLQTSKQQCVW